jgi:transcriptional regulator with XRE-family HTH domain
MTRRELSEQSGVSEPQIWNIETGKTLNPQAQTRERLTAVLGEAPSEETIRVTEDEAAIPDLGALTDFDPHDADNLPNEAGVYVFYDISERPVYVGQSENIRGRVSDHDHAFWFKRPIVETAAYVRITDPALRLQIETIMIRFLKSNAVINQKNVQRTSG